MGAAYRNPTPEELIQRSGNARCWARTGLDFTPVEETVRALPSGAYRCRMSSTGPYVQNIPIETDQLLVLPDSVSETLLKEFRQFWTLRSTFTDYGFLFKRGLLLWGPPGSGKTSSLWLLTQELIRSHDGIVVFVEDPVVSTTCLAVIRQIEPLRPMLVVMEDLDALVKQHGDHAFLALLDGETQISGVVFFATTNYPEQLDRRFVDRPSRFDTVREIAMPTVAARRAYLSAKCKGIDEITLMRWTRRTDGYSIAHLREAIIAIQCFGQMEEAVFARLDDMRDAKIAGNDGRRSHLGFSA